jgi:hypothetical protein
MEDDDLEGKQDDDAELLVPCGQQREHNCRKDYAICCPLRSSREDCRFVLRRVSKKKFIIFIFLFFAEEGVRIRRVKDGKEAGR